MKARFRALVRGRGARHRDDRRGDVLRRRDDDEAEPRRSRRAGSPTPPPTGSTTRARIPNSGSTDMGNVSWVCPTIHPELAICAEGVAGHSIRFRDAAATPAGRRDDPARGDARRPDAPTSCSPTRRSSRPPGASSAARPEPGQAANGRLPGAIIRAGAPRWTPDANRRRPQRDGDRDAGGPIGPVERTVSRRTRGRAPGRRPPGRRAPRRRRRARRRPDAARSREPGFAAANGWDRDYEILQRLRPADLRRADDVHEPAVDHRPGRAPRRGPSTSRSSARRSTTRSATGPARASGRGRSARRSTPRARSTPSSSASSRSSS